MTPQRDGPATMPTSSLFLPVLILGAVLCGWFGFQLVQLRAEQAALRETIARQERPIGESKKLRDSLDVLARGTAGLADGGNASARAIVDGFRQRGITISAATPTDPANAAPGAR